jgi:hypothetical protein
LSGADCAGAAGAEYDFVVWGILEGRWFGAGKKLCMCTEDSIFPDVAEVFVSVERHCRGVVIRVRIGECRCSIFTSSEGIVVVSVPGNGYTGPLRRVMY